ncbi:hypothetical protein RRG08_051983 [Elysia crispata]|uniref:Major facilitator superfamily (MFS) profile domain-containing protein n=1 Tax=Elysia crispata TaxID=231223 RepID=A0AAE0ZCE4_9GAST|nr:hypothetical protein RRG08_051983 [Elysia crispata]
MKFDDLLVAVGEFGPYQRRIYFLLCLPALLCGAQVLSAVFIMAIPDYRCKIPAFANDSFQIRNRAHGDLANMSIPRVSSSTSGFSQCLVYSDVWRAAKEYDHVEPAAGGLAKWRNAWNTTSVENGMKFDSTRETRQCHEWVYDRSEFDSTAITEFDLVCEDTILRSICNSVMFAGALVGAIAMGVVADVCGRKRAIMICLLAQFVTSLCVCLTPSFTIMIVLKSLSGIATHSLFSVGATMGIELVGPTKRSFTGMVVEFFWAGGILLALPIAYISRNWRYTQLTICLLTVPLFALWWLIPESPRWLLNKRRYTEARQVLEKICHSNRTKLPQDFLDADIASDGPQEGLSRLCSKRNLICRTGVIFFNWLAVNLLYYGLSLSTDNLSGSTYINYLLGVVLEILAYILTFLLVDKTGRRRFHFICMLVSGIACLATVLPTRIGGKEYQWLVTGFALTGRMFSSGAYAILYLMSAELFPTVVRNSAIGTCNVFESLGGIISPYIADLGLIVGGPFSQSLPMFVFGSVSLVAGGLSLTLPETLGQPMPETIQDTIDLNKRKKSLSPSNGFVAPMLDCNSQTPLSSSQV